MKTAENFRGSVSVATAEQKSKVGNGGFQPLKDKRYYTDGVIYHIIPKDKEGKEQPQFAYNAILLTTEANPTADSVGKPLNVKKVIGISTYKDDNGNWSTDSIPAANRIASDLADVERLRELTCKGYHTMQAYRNEANGAVEYPLFK